ncbi:MAG TPA: HEPN domain-containing protein [Bacillota bacterium]|nr:HEPN domain-containing protein [Bacillota bacterium]
METVTKGIKQELEQADQALTSMEEVLEKKELAPEIIPMAQQSGVALMRAFLLLKGEEPAGSNLRNLWNQCATVEAEFLEIQELIDYITPDEPLDDLDSEDFSEILDAANELWDFVVGFFPEDYLP